MKYLDYDIKKKKINLIYKYLFVKNIYNNKYFYFIKDKNKKASFLDKKTQKTSFNFVQFIFLTLKIDKKFY